MDNNNFDLKTIGQRIRETRIDRGLSQAELAFAADISEPHISRIEQGKQKMYLDTFVRLIEALQVSADYILRPDVPEVNAMYQKEFTDLFIDCSPTEMETLLNIVRQVKSSIHNQNKNDDN